jgi:hypothetical protein
LRVQEGVLFTVSLDPSSLAAVAAAAVGRKEAPTLAQSAWSLPLHSSLCLAQIRATNSDTGKDKQRDKKGGSSTKAKAAMALLRRGARALLPASRGFASGEVAVADSPFLRHGNAFPTAIDHTPLLSSIPETEASYSLLELCARSRGGGADGRGWRLRVPSFSSCFSGPPDPVSDVQGLISRCPSGRTLRAPWSSNTGRARARWVVKGERRVSPPCPALSIARARRPPPA